MATPSDLAFHDQLQQKVIDNLDYRSSASTTKAVLLLEAIDGLLLTRPMEARNGGSSGESIRFDQATLLEMKRDIEKWLSRRNIAANQFAYLEYCND